MEREARLKERIKYLQDSVSTDALQERVRKNTEDKVEIAALARIMELEKAVKARAALLFVCALAHCAQQRCM